MSERALSREAGPGMHWLPACLAFEYGGELLHGHISTFLVVGEERALMVDAGHPARWLQLQSALDRILGERPLDFVMPTHPEMPHSGALPNLVERYPNLRIVGDTRDYHIYYPDFRDRLEPMASGERIDLGGTAVVLLDPIVYDLPNTLWAYDERSRTLFVGDAFAFSHHHEAGECTLTSEELPTQPDIDQIGILNEAALYWTRYVDLERYFDRFDELLERLPVDLVAPAHGAMIANPAEMIPFIEDGMRAAQQRTRAKMKV